MSDSRVLTSFNRCVYTGTEQVHNDTIKLSHYNIDVFTDCSGNTRVLLYDRMYLEDDCIYKAGFILNSKGVVLQMYTAPYWRRQGLMKGMMALYQYITKNKIYWDNNLTEDGKAFYDAITKVN